MSIIRFAQVCIFGWSDAYKVSKKNNKSHISIYLDMINSYVKYKIKTAQYIESKFYELEQPEKALKGAEMLEENKKREKWYRRYYKTKSFLANYTNMKYESSMILQHLRNLRYKKFFRWDNLCWVHNNVIITCEHNREGKFVMGKNVVLSNSVEIDYTGDITLGNGVDIMEGAKILTHAHDFFGGVDESKFIPGSNRAYCTPLIIGDNVLIGSRCFIMPGVKEIGENSVVSAGSFVKKRIPANSIVAGNPAKVIGEISEGMRVYYAYKTEED